MSKLHLEIFPCFPVGNFSKPPLGSRKSHFKTSRDQRTTKENPYSKTCFFDFIPQKPPKPIFQKPKKKYIEHVLFFVAGPKNLSNKFSKPPSRPLKNGPVLRPGGSVPKRCDPLAWIKMSRCEEITHQQRHVSAGSFRSP